MDAKIEALYAAFLRELKRLLQLQKPLKDWDADFGKGEGYCYNFFSKEAQVSVRFLLWVCDKLNVSAASVLRAVYLHSNDDPVTVLKSHRESQQLPANSFLDELQPRLDHLLSLQIDKNLPVTSELSILEALEEKRFSDRLGTLKATEELAARIVAKLESIPGSKPGKLVGELAAAIALWATIQRARGQRDLAVKALALAFPLARHSRNYWARGVCYQRASFVLNDLGRPDLGLDFNREALICFATSGATSNLPKCHVNRGFFLTGCDRLDEAKEAFTLGLEQLPGSDWRYRVGASQGLGLVARRDGQLAESRSHLLSALSQCSQTDLFVGHVRWSLALTEFKLGAFAKARRSFEEATDVIARFGTAGDVALVCVDHVEILLHQKEYKRVGVIVSEVSTWLPQLGANPILSKTFGKFLDLALVARIELDALPDFRSQLRQAWKSGEIG